MRVLIADDDPVARVKLRSLLKKWSYRPVLADNGDEAWRILSGDDPPLICILDWMMPGLDGIDLCKRIRALKREPYTYLILVTGKGRPEDIVLGMGAGADDYVTKRYDHQELEVRVRAGRRVVDLQLELIHTRDRLQYEATHDHLTGHLNRGETLQQLDRELARAKREETEVGVAMIDVDFFKRVNDTHGHGAGDEVLREVARRLKSALRSYDVLGRIGGEEFVAVVPACGPEDLTSVGERLRSVVASTPVVVNEDLVLPVTVSVGLAASVKGEEATGDKLLMVADAALYRAKRDGRDRVVLAKNASTSGTFPAVDARIPAVEPKTG
jgi:diguanylate cyclase (GGDEF)-like protein